MGSWGEMPWESDAGLDLAWDLLDELFKKVSALLTQMPGPSSTASDTDRLKTCCDLVVRLHPYWHRSTQRQDVSNAIGVMERIIPLLLTCEELVEPNNDRILADLRALLVQLPE